MTKRSTWAQRVSPKYCVCGDRLKPGEDHCPMYPACEDAAMDREFGPTAQFVDSLLTLGTLVFIIWAIKSCAI